MALPEFSPPTKIKVGRLAGKGRGVICTDLINQDEIIEICPLVPLGKPDVDALKVQDSILNFYALELLSIQRHVIPVGYGVLYNHSDTPNSEIEYKAGQDYLFIRALREIKPGEEITFDYLFDPNEDKFLSTSAIDFNKLI